MKTVIKKIDANTPDAAVLEAAGDILRAGGLVAFPTETVYGLGGDGLNPEAARRIYEAKGRPSDNPLILHIADMDALSVLAVDVSRKAVSLAEKFWPGPLTMVLKASDGVPRQTTGGLDTVALRMPSHPVASMLIKSSGVYIAAPSANLSGRPSPTRAEHVIEDLRGRVDMIIDGGPVDIGLESTIVDMTGDTPVILRPGFITEAMLAEAVGSVDYDPSLLRASADETVRPKAPGMKYRHYAPKGELSIVEGSRESVAGKINELLLKDRAEGQKSAVICVAENAGLYHCDIKEIIGSAGDEESIAYGLYEALRQADSEGAERIYCESFSGGGLSMAVMNRLFKAAGYRIIKS